MTLFEIIQDIENGLELNPADDYEYKLTALKNLEDDLPVYRFYNVPVWKIQRAKEEISRIRAWIREELEHKMFA